MPSLYSKAAHKAGVLSLYRALIRYTKQIDNIPFRGSKSGDLSPAIQAEQTKYNLDPQLYIQQIKFEWKYSIRQDFDSLHNDEKKTVQSFIRGAEIEQKLRDSKEKPLTLLEILVQYRQHKFQEQKWRANYLENKEEIAKEEQKSVNELELRRRASKVKRRVNPISKFGILSPSEQRTVIKQELEKSREFSAHLLRRYLKLKQQTHQLPIPHLLPNTPENDSVIPSFKSKYAIPGSTKHDMISSGYDLDYINAIVKPSLEYDINKYHYLDNLKRIVTEKGPYPVKISTTSAGAIPIPYIKTPLPRLKQMREVALDTKRSWTWIRIRNVWNSSPRSVKDEKMFSDGRYSIIGSKGFGPEEFIYPRSHYEDLAKQEALWEYILDKERGTLTSSLENYNRSWIEPLETTTRYLDAKVDEYFSKYATLRQKDSELHKERDQLQKQMNQHYDFLVKKYNRLLKVLKSDTIFKHSEIVNGSTVKQTYRQILKENSRSKKEFGGLPEQERVGMGKRLSDYLEDSKSGNFKWGKKFYDRFRFDIKSS